MNRKNFLGNILSAVCVAFVPKVLMAKRSTTDKKIEVPKWIVDRFGNEDQIDIERMYHDSEFLFPESDHNKIMVNEKVFYPWKLRCVYPAYKGDMYFFKIDEKFRQPGKALVSYFSR